MKYRLTSTCLLAWTIPLAPAAPAAPQVSPVVLEHQRFLSNDASPGDRIGSDVLAISGETAIFNTVDAVYVFVRSGGLWTQQAKLSQPRAISSVSLSGNTIAVGLPGFWPQRNEVVLYVRTGGTWTVQTVLTGPNGFSYLTALDGNSLAVHESTIVNVFVRSGVTWSLQARIPMLPIPITMELQGDTLAVSTVYGVQIHVRSGTTWTQQALLTPPQPQPPPIQYYSVTRFGASMALDGDSVAVGASLDNGVIVRSGVVYVFERAGTQWSTGTAVVAGDGWAEDAFGTSVDLEGDHLLVGAPGVGSTIGFARGAAYQFRRSGASWTEEAKLVAGDCCDPPGGPADGWPETLGARVALADREALVSNPGDFILDLGSIYAFHLLGRLGRPLCMGDGTGSACPCGNASPHLGRGCATSTGAGMALSARGRASVSADNLELTALGVPPGNAGLFLAGDQELAPAAFGDGLLCAGGTIRRFRSVVPSAGGTASDSGFVAQDTSGSYFVPGRSYVFQYWTRDAGGPCGGQTNLSHAYAVTATP